MHLLSLQRIGLDPAVVDKSGSHLARLKREDFAEAGWKVATDHHLRRSEDHHDPGAHVFSRTLNIHITQW